MFMGVREATQRDRCLQRSRVVAYKLVNMSEHEKGGQYVWPGSGG
jgi:hypothetical protein